MSLVLYSTSVSSSSVTKGNIHKIKSILSSKKIEFEEKDISTDQEAKEKMKSISADNEKPNALPPILCKGDEYLGDFEAFEMAVEDGTLEEFLKLK